jgi:REP element-mobilizing transposase RayT
MKYDPNKHRRRSIRLKGYDYTSAGAYFVTICVDRGECLLGEIVDGEMELDAWGQIAAELWLWLEDRYPYVTLDAWVIMPNHMHGIIIITDDPPGRGGSRTAPTPTAPTPTAPTPSVKRKPLGRLVGAFKTVSTKNINELRFTPGARFWQRNYWEHIIRNENSLNCIRQYIETNPVRWAEDQLHPDAPPNPFNQW